jgi:hypothetical protein
MEQNRRVQRLSIELPALDHRLAGLS